MSRPPRGARPSGAARRSSPSPRRRAAVPIELYRIDDRLVHGQVVVGWGQPLQLGFIVLVDDAVAASEWEQELYRMGVPPEMEVRFESVASALEHLAEYEARADRGLLLTADVGTMRKLVEGSRLIRTVNLGGVHHRPGRAPRLRYVFLAPAASSSRPGACPARPPCPWPACSRAPANDLRGRAPAARAARGAPGPRRRELPAGHGLAPAGLGHARRRARGPTGAGAHRGRRPRALCARHAPVRRQPLSRMGHRGCRGRCSLRAAARRLRGRAPGGGLRRVARGVGRRGDHGRAPSPHRALGPRDARRARAGRCLRGHRASPPGAHRRLRARRRGDLALARRLPPARARAAQRGDGRCRPLPRVSPGARGRHGGVGDLARHPPHEWRALVPGRRPRRRRRARPRAMTAGTPHLPFATRAAIFARLFAVQGSWNYETLLGNGIAFAVEPALRLLPGGKGGAAYRAALARQGGYFNAHPYLASVAVGALARAELEGEAPERIERFRTACSGPLGSVGDRLIWAGWLPACAP